MNKLLFLDVEYANTKNKSICQLGLLGEEFPGGEPIFPEKNIYINPEDGFQDLCINIHGITPKQVQNERNFAAVWEKIKFYFSDAIIVGHNVLTSDLIALAKSCARYDIKLPALRYIDTMQLARKFIPMCEVDSFTLKNLCKYFDIDTGNSHDAFDDACATADLFKSLVDIYNINVDNHIEIFTPEKSEEFINYVANPEIRRNMCEFYGVVEGVVLDNKIRPEEEAYIKDWRINNSHLKSVKELSDIFTTIDNILKDNIITLEEMLTLKSTVKNYYETICGSQITISLQELRGILKGIIIDNEISTLEGQRLRNWLYNNTHLNDHYPYNHILSLFEEVLKDNIITKEESESLIKIIDSLLTPVENFKDEIISVCNKRVCLSGNFSHGRKSDIEKIIIEKGGIVESDLKKITDILIIGDFESPAYAHGNYGTKVRKAMEFNSKGGNISIIKEKDFFAQPELVKI